ncbi:MAG: hypothetical protein ABII89_02275 [Candidatus Omnitrophota bacterium]
MVAQNNDKTMEPIDYFDNLTCSIATVRLLLQKAHKNGSLIEGLCLYVSAIDGLLRLAIVYTRTQKSPDHKYSFEKRLIYQDDGERTYSEKEIYRIALEEQVISPELYQKLLDMYEFRNKVIHRFSISTITCSQIAEACIKFERIYNEIFKIVEFLEHGPHGPKPIDKKTKQKIFERIKRKI